MADYAHSKSNPGFKQEKKHDETPPIDVSKITIKVINKDLFDSVAQNAAKSISEAKNELNKPTQLRRFYDEIVMWDQKLTTVHDDKRRSEKFLEYLPFIKMLNAKVAYAKGRKLVDNNFVELINHCLKQIDSYQDLKNFKLFMEAFMGFYKEKRQKD